MEKREKKDIKEEMEKMCTAIGFGTAMGRRRRLLDAAGGGQGKARARGAWRRAVESPILVKNQLSFSKMIEAQIV